jgi:hypothetical protein
VAAVEVKRASVVALMERECEGHVDNKLSEGLPE